MKMILSSLLSFMFVFLSQSANCEAGEIVLKLNRPESVLKSSEEVRLTVSVKNVSDHEAVIVRTPGVIPEEQLRYQVNVRDSDGKKPPETAYFKEFNSPSAIVQTSNISHKLKPGESVSDAIILTKLYVLKPGKYRVWVSRDATQVSGGAVKSNEITITIVN